MKIEVETIVHTRKTVNAWSFSYKVKWSWGRFSNLPLLYEYIPSVPFKQLAWMD
jgi:hypothetical protein